MSRIDDLVARLSPSGVPHLPLGEVGAFVRGNGLQKSDLRDQGIPAIHYGQIHTYYKVWAVETKSFVDPSLANRLKKASTGDLVIATTSEDDAAVGKATAWLGDSDVAVSGDAYIYHHSLDPKYVAYYFQSDAFQSQKVRFISGTKVRRISGGSLSKIKIPVPPLEVQQEVVRILDKFTRLAAELEAELEARLGQYSYYRGRLLEFADSTPRVPLGEIAVIGTGSHDTKDAAENGQFTFYARGRDPLRLDVYDFDEQAIITAGDGVGVGKVFHFADGKYALHQRAYRIVPNAGVNARFVYHYLRHDFANYLERTSVHASVTSLRRPMFLKYGIPIPELQVQNEIAQKLDRFEALVSDQVEGIPAEVEARRHQYGYYRDKLLTFEAVS